MGTAPAHRHSTRRTRGRIGGTRSVSEGEVASLVEAYADYRAGIDSLYALPETRYASPALTFSATPVFADWSE